MKFADRLRILRNAAKLTQEQLALACGYAGQSRIANYETLPPKPSAREPTLDEVPALAAALGAPVAALLDDEALAAFQSGEVLTSQLSRQSIDNIVDAVRVAISEGAMLTPESFELAYHYVMARAKFTAATRETANIADKVSSQNVLDQRTSEGTGTPRRRAAGPRKK